MSRLFIYYNARVKSPDFNGKISDNGSNITCALEALKELGSCDETIWPYDARMVNVRPNKEAFRQAENLQITGSMIIEQSLYHMKACLAQHFPFVFGLLMHTAEFDKQGRNDGRVRTPPSHKPMPTSGLEIY